MWNSWRNAVVLMPLMTMLLAGCDRSSIEYNRALLALMDGNHVAGIAGLNSLAQSGYPPAQFRLGVMTGRGWGVRPDPVQAVQWIRTAARNGDLPAQYFLAGLYQSGTWLESDLEQALAWFQRAAEQGFIPAQFQTGMLYAESNDDPGRQAHAVDWMRRAAGNGHQPAMLTIAQWYQEGRFGLPQNAKAAAQWRERTQPRKIWSRPGSAKTNH